LVDGDFDLAQDFPQQGSSEESALMVWQRRGSSIGMSVEGVTAFLAGMHSVCKAQIRVNETLVVKKVAAICADWG